MNTVLMVVNCLFTEKFGEGDGLLCSGLGVGVGCRVSSTSVQCSAHLKAEKDCKHRQVSVHEIYLGLHMTL